MSLIANNQIIKTFKEKMESELTCSGMEKSISVLSDILSMYNIERNVIDNTGNDVILEAYLDAMTVEGLSQKTIDRYNYILKRFFKAIQTSTMNITRVHITKYLSDEKARGISDSTIKGYCWVFSAYFGWLHRDGILQKNPMGNIGKIKVKKKVKEVFTEVDIEKLKDNCKTIRDKAIICFLKSTGCRISEMTQLNIADIDFINLECIVLGKGNKQRTVYMDAVTAMLLKKYLDTRTDDDPALFIGKRKNRFNPSGVRCMLKNVGVRAGVAHVHPHKFRRTEITELVNRGMPIEQVKALAGHEKIDTTMQYVVIDQNLVKSAYRKFA